MKIKNKTSSEIDNKNRSFWDELCGTALAKSIGVVDDSPASLKRFDDWYFDFYPYLFREIPFGALKGKRVLEIGLGYGSVGQRLAEAGANYVGLDIANGPVSMIKRRLNLINAESIAIQASILDCPLQSATFDAVVAIGSLHHSGDLQRALDQVYRILRKGGSAYIMLYNAYSYRRWMKSFKASLQMYLSEQFGIGRTPVASAKERAQYDKSADGSEAPFTVFTSPKQLRKMCKRWTTISINKENIGQEGPFVFMSRDKALRYGKMFGLDLYCKLTR